MVHAESLTLFLIPNQSKRPSFATFEFCPTHERIFAAMRDPKLLWINFAHRLSQFVPICVVGENQWELHAALLCSLTNAHPT